jgi:hypothetical protein
VLGGVCCLYIQGEVVFLDCSVLKRGHCASCFSEQSVTTHILTQGNIGSMNEWYLGLIPSRPAAPKPSNRPSVPHTLLLGYRCPVPLPKFQMAPIINFPISSGSKKKEPRCAHLSVAKA